MNNSFGEIFRLTTFGESHGAGLGAVLDGVPPGLPLTEADIQTELDRRRPGQSAMATPRRESDRVEILSGVFQGITTGTPLAMLIRNTDTRSADYETFSRMYRPGHADFGYCQKFGIRDYRGGGRSSGRETAARVAGGAVAKKLLAAHGITFTASTVQVGHVSATRYCPETIEANPLRTADPDAAPAMIEAVQAAMRDGDSIGGVVECRIAGVPAGWGEPVFDKLDAELAKAIISLGGVKGIEFGDGFRAATARGSANNDAMLPSGFATNHAGGILGGISTGAEIVFRAAVKPTPSIRALQSTVDADGNPVELSVPGRHDPCLCGRIVPVVEAMAALVLADMMLRHRRIHPVSDQQLNYLP